MNDKLKIFAGSASRELGREICDYLGIPLGDSITDKFDNDNSWVKINENVREKDVFIVQTSCRPVNDGFMEALIMTDALKRASAKRITMVMPYYAYARSEKKDQPRVPITAALVAKLLQAAGVSRIVTMDLHAEAIMGFFDGPVDQLLAINLMTDYFNKKKLENIVAVSPDAGAAKRTRYYAKLLGCHLAILDKRRDEKETEVLHVIGDVKNKTAIIFDDEISSGGSMRHAAEAVKNFGAKEVYAACTHAVFGKGIQKNINQSKFTEVVVTNTIPVNLDPPIEKLTVLSVAPLFGEVIKNIHTGESVSSLFQIKVDDTKP